MTVATKARAKDKPAARRAANIVEAMDGVFLPWFPRQRRHRHMVGLEVCPQGDGRAGDDSRGDRILQIDRRWSRTADSSSFRNC
jgi:hypothetical protein